MSTKLCGMSADAFEFAKLLFSFIDSMLALQRKKFSRSWQPARQFYRIDYKKSRLVVLIFSVFCCCCCCQIWLDSVQVQLSLMSEAQVPRNKIHWTHLRNDYNWQLFCHWKLLSFEIKCIRAVCMFIHVCAFYCYAKATETEEEEEEEKTKSYLLF